MSRLITLFFVIVVFYGSLGVGIFEINILAFLLFNVAVSILALKRNIKIPPLFTPYLLFLIILLISFLWSYNTMNSFLFFVSFSSGGLIWILFYNLKKIEDHFYEYLLILLGFIFAFLFFIPFFSNNLKVNPFSLFSPIWFDTQHVHLGDYWVVVFLIALSFFLVNKSLFSRIFYLIILIFGLYIIYISSSRSAMLASLVGTLMLVSFRSKINILRPQYFLILLFIFIFLATATGKSVFTSRDYFIQGLAGLYHHPFGIGGGNFNLISEDRLNQILWFNKTSSFAHNIFIEMTSAVGIFAFYFIYLILRLLIEGFSKRSLYWILFVAIFVNFFFDYTYAIPAMFFLWFSFLGLAQKNG